MLFKVVLCYFLYTCVAQGHGCALAKSRAAYFTKRLRGLYGDAVAMVEKFYLNAFEQAVFLS